MSVRIKKFGIAAGLLLALSACLVGGNAVATGKDAAVAKEIQTKLPAGVQIIPVYEWPQYHVRR